MRALEKLILENDINSEWQIAWYKQVKKQYPSLDKLSFNKTKYNLKNKKYISLNPIDKTFSITKRGRKYILLDKIRNWEIDKVKEKNYSRLILFDIPETKKFVRNVIREKLEQNNCRRIQKSAYITNHVCEKSIGYLSKLLNVTRHVIVLVVLSKK